MSPVACPVVAVVGRVDDGQVLLDLGTFGELGGISVRVRRRDGDELADGEGLRENDAYVSGPGGAGRDVQEPQIALALAVSRRVAGGVREVLDPQIGAGRSGSYGALDYSAAYRHGGNDWEVLQVVGSDIEIVGVVGGNAVTAEVDPEGGVGEDPVRLDVVPRPRHDPYSVRAVVSDGVGLYEVPGPRRDLYAV